MPIMWSQPAIFNVLDPWYEVSLGVFVGMVPGPGGDPVQNTQVLLAIINLAQASNDQSGPYYGAIIVFPGHSQLATQGGTGEDDGGIYFMQGPGDGTPTIPIVSNWPIKFLGTGSAKLLNYVGTDEDFVAGDFFSIQTNGDYGPDCDKLEDNSGGMTFENLSKRPLRTVLLG